MVDFAVRVLPELVSDGGMTAPDLYKEAAREVRAAAAALLAATFSAGQVELLVSLANTHSDVYATAGYPAITVPLGLDEAGAPNGVTFIGKPGEEARLLAFAYAFEQVTGYRVALSDRAE
jgi:amidase